jgi:hypothetical protein
VAFAEVCDLKPNSAIQLVNNIPMANKERSFEITTTTRKRVPIGDSSDEVLKMAYGGKPEAVPEGGGTAEGPSHEEGGIDVVQKGEGGEGAKPVAEIEGGERVFSQEDTQALEQASEQIIQAQQSGDKAGAEDMAMRLGFAVVQMIAAQEQNQEAQEQQMSDRAPEPAPDAAAMNSFAQEPDQFAQ